MNKKLAIPALIGVLALTACGQNGHQTGSSTQKAEPEATTSISSASVQPIANSALTAAKLTGQACSLDSVDGNYAVRVRLAKGTSHVLRGWLEDKQQKPAGSFHLILSGDKNFSVPATTGVARPDVASGQSNPALAKAGFNLSIDFETLPAGEYTVRFLMGSGDEASWCNAKKSIIVP